MHFQAISEGSLLYYASSSQGGGVNMALLYLLPQGTSNPPASIPFAESWNSFSGTYLFLEQPLAVSTAPAFAASAWSLLAHPHYLGTRFLWLNAPQGARPLTGSNLAVYQPHTGGPYVTAFEVNLEFQNISLMIAANIAIAPDVENFAFVLKQSGQKSIYLTAIFGAVPVHALGPVLTIPFTGKVAGCLQFAANFSVQNLADLDVGLRYYFASTLGLEDPTQATDDFFLSSLRYPIFREAVQLYGNFDPLAPLAHERTFFAFNGIDGGQPHAGLAAAVATNYSSNLGDVFSLLPQAGSAKLVFAVNRQASTPNSQDPYYLVPSGDFLLTTTRQNTVNLMCGLSGVEYVALNNAPGTTNKLTFYPGQPAFAPGFYPEQPPGYTKVAPLTAALMPTTSFVWISSIANQTANPLDYFAQPDESVLYNYGATPNNISGLAPVAVLANTLPAAPPTGALFPALPYGGLSGSYLAPFAQMETQAVGPTRRLALAKTGNPTTPSDPEVLPSVFSATPQGLLVQYVEGAVTWPTVILGMTQTSNLQPQPFQLTNVEKDLLTALETNKLFLVATDATVFSDYLTTLNAQISVGDPKEAWSFNIDPAGWSHSPTDSSENTIFILKFSDLSVNDLAGETTAWAFPGEFNRSPTHTSATIKQIIQSANPADSDFAEFLYAVNTPSWNGILILNATAPLTELPPQLAGLAAGIDPSLFFAHHVGINASKILVPSNQQLTIANSNIFGLINYVGGPLGKSSDDYQFTVRKLKVLFTNSAVAGFASTIDVQINSLFAERANLPDAAANNIVEMFGVYQKHIVNGIAQDSYSFQTATGLSALFNMTSQVFHAVQISQGQFITNTAQSSATLTESQFVFWGLMDFQNLKGFDAFSFGRQSKDDPAAGLQFGKLAIQMSYHPKDTSGPGGKPKITFAFDASQIAFDLAASTPRKASFFSHFPLTLAGFTQAKQGVTAASLGFMSVQTPLNQSLLSYPWFSLNFNLNLGSTGALAAQAGFVATLTLGWSPSRGQDYVVFTGLKLPGSSGSKREINIEGIFDISFKTLEIVAIPDKETYILVLYGIAFDFLKFHFPPSGQVNFVLFGNPGESGSGANLGWYAAYAKTEKSGGGDSKSQGILAGAQLTRLASGLQGGLQ